MRRSTTSPIPLSSTSASSDWGRAMGCCCCGGGGACHLEEEKTGWARVDAKIARLCERLESWRTIVISGACVLMGLLVHMKAGGMGCGEASPWWDPALIAVLLCGLPIAYQAIRTLLVNHRITSALLITMAMIAALAIGEFFAAGEVAFIMAIGEKLEDFTVGRASKGVKALIRLKDAVRKDISVGTVVSVRPGESFPCDGVVTKGETTVDQSIVTGESLPVRKVVGDRVYTGTLNRYGQIEIRATAVGADTSLAKIVRLVNEANNHKAPMQRLADRWAAILVPSALGVAVVTFAVCYWALGVELHNSLTRAVTVLVTFCPCALALATPTSIMAAIGQATKRGVLIKTGEALERMGAVNTVTFDKTGTITKGTWANALARDADGRILAGEKMDVADELRETAPATVRRLSELGVKSLLLTGDHREIAEKYASACGIGEVRADLLPEEKVEAVRSLTAAGRHVAMVGDGVNDAAAMKYADVGIAMAGAGTDVAAEASDIAIMNDDIASVAYVKRLALACLRTIRFNITLSMSINFVAVLLGVLGIMTPVVGALVHNGGSILVVLNAALLYDRRLR